MKILSKIKKAIKNPSRAILYILGKPWVNRFISDKNFLKIKFRLAMGEGLNLKNPQTFNQKLQWLKLYDRKDKYTMMADKYSVREYIAKTIGEEYLVPLLGVWEKAEDIDFNKLPDKFVLKCTHNSGKGMCICKDKSKLDIEKVRKELNEGLKENYFLGGREWCYKNIKPRIIAEQFLVDESGVDLKDYKFMCFSGKVKCILVCSERFFEDGVKITFFDNNWDKISLQRMNIKSNADEKRPYNFEQMIDLAEKLSAEMPFTRVDFYEVNKKIVFGELTFYPASGFEKFSPEEWDYTLGSWLTLPEKDI